MATVFLLEADRLHFRVASGPGFLEGETVGCLVEDRLHAPPGFVLSEGRQVIAMTTEPNGASGCRRPVWRRDWPAAWRCR